MNINTEVRNSTYQHRLFPKGIKNWAQTRNECGEFAEQLTCAVSGAARGKTTGAADYCPDVFHPDGSYGEIKSVGNNGAAIIYRARLTKDESLCRAVQDGGHGRRLFYWFWRHRCIADGKSTVEQLRRAMAGAVEYAVLLPFASVHAIASARPLRMLNKKYSGGGSELGYGNRSKGYGDGYSIPVTALRRATEIRVMIEKVTLPDSIVAGPYVVHTTNECLNLLPNRMRWC